ncbi:MAG: S41 family peptidase [Bacteroidales bacterium]|nr:S41 family peptidase [Bacteroidales bacterium]
MNKTLFAIILTTLTADAFSQSNVVTTDFNFGFENTSITQKLPDKWFQWGSNYLISIDTSIKHSGENSIIIQPSEGRTANSFGCVAYSIPAQYEGKEIELRAFMKLLDVSEGPIGLMLRIDGSSGSLQFDNMQRKNIMGTSDWTLYSVKLPYPQRAKTIYIGAILSGKGQLWVDDFELLIDGVSIEKVKKVKPEELKADLDREFDKGSGIQNFEINEQRIEDLKLLGLVWGFLKYYHPNIAAGNFNWDYELFRIIPQIIKTKSPKERDNILCNWITSLGAFDNNGKSFEADSEIKIMPDLEWISKSNLSKELTTLLLNVENAKRTGKNYYISLADNVRNPVFSNENAYAWMNFPDIGFRLLSLYRYWNIIQYYSPYKYLIEENWEEVLGEFIPKFINASDETQYRLKVLELIARVNDTHANIWSDNILSRYLGINYAPYEIQFIEGVPVISNCYEVRSNFSPQLQKGDVILSINKKPVDKILSDRVEISPASNYPTKLRYIARNLLRTNDSILNIEFKRGDISLQRIVRTFPQEKINMTQKMDTCFKFIQPDIAYLYPGSIKNKYLPSIMSKVQDSKGLIIDLRCYPSEFIVFTLSSFLMPQNTPFVKFSRGSIEYPGLFVIDKGLLSVGRNNSDFYKGKVIILVNETTISQAEYTAMALRIAPKATVVGSTTAGADGNVSPFSLPGGVNTMITGIGVYYPDGSETQRVGIIPDIEIKPTIQGLKRNQDELLEKAVEIILK